VANGTPTSGELDLGHVFRGWHTPLNIEGPRSRQSCARGSGYRPRSCIENKDFSRARSVRLKRGHEKTCEPPSPVAVIVGPVRRSGAASALALSGPGPSAGPSLLRPANAGTADLTAAAAGSRRCDCGTPGGAPRWPRMA
jgi:hypothetical protein